MKKENLKAEKNETLCMGEQRFFFPENMQVRRQ